MSNFEQSLDGIAIIGLSGRFPGSRNVEEFWQNLQNGVESITFFTEEELLAAGIDPALVQDPNYVKAHGVFADKAMFDAAFFEFTPREAEIADPQHRLLLECAHEALEHAGYTPQVNNRIGVFAGVTSNGYIRNVFSHPQLVESVGDMQVNLGNVHDFLATRLSYKLNLHGPAMTIQTACSTSLVAIHQACQSLLMMECDMALAGGASTSSRQKEGYLFQEGSIGSPDGHCRSFDEQAQGTIGGEGCGVVLLKRLAEAVEDGDTIYAVIKGSAINNDGSDKIGFTAPSVDGQAEAIVEALAVAGISPETIGYVEAHGTATPLGDPIEIEALTQAYRANTEVVGYCAIGSVKSNVGHLDAAAGVTGLIKTVMALQHEKIPASLHFAKPNPKIDFANSPFFVNPELREWKKGTTPRRAGVSSFGMGGTNAHVVLEEAPRVATSSSSREQQLLVLSAKTATALEAMTANLAAHLQAHPEQALADVAYTLQTGRRTFKHRRLLVARDHADAVQALQALDPARVVTHGQEQTTRSVAFLFPGQGAQYVNMGRELYEKEPVFRAEVDRCAEVLQPHLGLDVRGLIYPSAEQTEAAIQQLAQTMYTQPAIFVIEYALAQLWQSWGVQPAAMIGHSIGEYVAACLAGVLSLEDALVLVATRGKLMQELPGGSMLAIPLPEADVTAMLGSELSLAAVNGPSACVVSGTTEAVEALAERLKAQEIVHHRLDTSHAFHSAMMEPILERFAEVVRGVKLNAPTMPYVSNVTGTWITAEEATDPAYWTKHLRGTVRYAAGVRELVNTPGQILLEVGPGRVLGTLAGQLGSAEEQEVVALYSLRHRDEMQSDLAFLLGTLGKLWMHGFAVDWSALYAEETRRRVPVPTYPFERQTYWIDFAAGEVAASKPQGKKADIADWFYLPVWKRSLPPELLGADESDASQQQHALVFLDNLGLGAQLAKRLEQAGSVVATVAVGDAFAITGEQAFVINPQLRADYSSLFEALAVAGQLPQQIYHLWGVVEAEADAVQNRLATYATSQQLGFYSLFNLAQALGEQSLRESFRIAVVTNHLQDVIGEDVLAPERSTMLGACKVIPQEFANIACQNIDVELLTPGSRAEEQLLNHLIAEMTAASTDTCVAYRRNRRWVRTFDEARWSAHSAAKKLRTGGTYLITGATEPNGLALAEQLVSTHQAQLVLIGRPDFPSVEEWDKLLSEDTEQGATDITQQAIQRLSDLVKQNTLFLSADVTDLHDMQQAIRQAHDRFGDIHGVFHTAEARSSGLLQLKTPELVAGVLDPKVLGTLVLDTALQAAELDFFALYSSTTALLGGLGQVDSSAANAFLDAYAHHRTATGRYTVAINWSTWQWDDWLEAQSAGVPEFQQTLRAARETYGITAAEGLDVLKRTLASGLPQVVVSTQDFHEVLAFQGSFTAAYYLSAVEEARSGQGADDVSESRDYIAPTNETEQSLAGIWQEIFGIKRVSLHDNFFELGGNSLVAIQLITRMRQTFKMDFPINVIFESPSVAGLAQVIASKQLDQEKIDKLEQMLREIEALSLQEVQSKLNTDGK